VTAPGRVRLAKPAPSASAGQSASPPDGESADEAVAREPADEAVAREPVADEAVAREPADEAVAREPADEAVAREPASFRDPSGFVYRRDGQLLRQVNASYAPHWEHLGASGLYAELVERGWLVAHEEAPLDDRFDERAWRVLRPVEIDFVAYPYEWTFGQLKDAALLTLDVQSAAMRVGMQLKDASAYNVQFQGGRPALIDALSFERVDDDAPWVAYRQFCQHFLAPLALMAQRDVRSGLLLRDFIDGIPLDLAARLLPATSRLRFGLATHVHLHARAQAQHAQAEGNSGRRPRLSRNRLEALLDSLRSTVEGLRWKPAGTEWAEYGETTSYTPTAAASKVELVGQMLRQASGRTLWDLGANTGYFSRLAADLGRNVVAIDGDAAAAERHYLYLKEIGSTSVTPLVVDLANPSPALGWAHRERMSLLERANADVVMALALVHHLAIGNNVPLPMVSELFARLGVS
jgi:hypothetical protein